jgi:hypothetical protein
MSLERLLQLGPKLSLFCSLPLVVSRFPAFDLASVVVPIVRSYGLAVRMRVQRTFRDLNALLEIEYTAWKTMVTSHL